MANTAKAFDASDYALAFWNGKLQPAVTLAPEASVVLAALKHDYPSALKTYARRVGIGSAAYLFVRGTGTVVAIERTRVVVDVGGHKVAVRTGPIFGSAVRDGSGLIEVNQVPGLTEFNALSAELNRLVESRVQPILRTVSVGRVLSFAGLTEAPEALPESGPLLSVIPVHVEPKP
jgi:predicted lipoprotein